MDWVKTFYSKQNEWFGVYLGEVEEPHHKRAWLVQEMANLIGRASILELGGGGGQTAFALANLGHEVQMIELLPDSAAHAQKLAAKMDKGKMTVIQGDFYEVNFSSSFDIVCYFDSFGIGNDEDQRRLLRRIASWLKPQGQAIIEIGATWYWGGVANGVTMDLGAGFRSYGFDPIESRLIDRWWLPDNPDEVYFQSLRCYTPADLRLLLQDTGLSLKEIRPGGKVNYQDLEFVEKAPLEEAMTYYVLLGRE